MSTRNSNRRATEKEKKAPEEKPVVVLVNMTAQKQVIVIDEKSYEFTAYGKRTVESTKEEAEHKFKLWINKNIINIQ